MTWDKMWDDLFNITPHRARETLRNLGFLSAEERAKRQVAERQPLPYVETPENVKRARAEALQRRLAVSERKEARS